MLILRSIFVLILLAGCVQAGATEFRGNARVVDGDTLSLGGKNLRIFGIDAPELAQRCLRNGVDWDCGAAARQMLARRIAAAEVICDVVTAADRHGRPVVSCTAQGEDIGQFMVRNGFAMAYVRYSDRYLADEGAARAEKTGIWAGVIVAPELYRQSGGAVGPEGCAIKGNIGTSGRIYHVPGQRDYERARIDQNSGEAWFCSEADAKSAGFRAAKR